MSVRVVTAPASVRFIESDDRSRPACVSRRTFTWHQCAWRMSAPSRMIMRVMLGTMRRMPTRACARLGRNIVAAMAPDLLRSLGQRARARRLERGWTLREIAERSGVSHALPRPARGRPRQHLGPPARRRRPRARGHAGGAHRAARPMTPSRSSHSSACAAPARPPSAGGSRAGCVSRSSSSTVASSRRPT